MTDQIYPIEWLTELVIRGDYNPCLREVAEAMAKDARELGHDASVHFDADMEWYVIIPGAPSEPQPLLED